MIRRLRAMFGGGDVTRLRDEAAGAERPFLPPDSLDLNPIEQVLTTPKRALRCFHKRTVDTLWDEIGRLIGPDHFPPAECVDYIRGSGYRIV